VGEIEPKLTTFQAKAASNSSLSEATQHAEQVRAPCKTLAGFVREAWHVLHPATPYIHSWHIELICAHEG
jgi:hypothetical protein